MRALVMHTDIMLARYRDDLQLCPYIIRRCRDHFTSWRDATFGPVGLLYTYCLPGRADNVADPKAHVPCAVMVCIP